MYMGALEFDLQLKTMMYLLLTLSLKLYLEQHYKHFFCAFLIIPYNRLYVTR